VDDASYDYVLFFRYEKRCFSYGPHDKIEEKYSAVACSGKFFSWKKS
jgi:hypothetical protein